MAPRWAATVKGAGEEEAGEVEEEVAEASMVRVKQRISSTGRFVSLRKP